ncbi:hypothetical protein PRIPAC_79400 [Pristionchus pacificus]|uniref:Uncharacterized protein n=1 Tax=Pristionchus pacificus TaxID=54126 RepID=A0A2A6BWP9_PRIPA|nr:hypothetical protein PRIPAC_79400 [Pristionchus pacificus]|eukprot:PDM70266.1 hypothetical protein PRIPAC_46512 [Pristionchus pacificus]
MSDHAQPPLISTLAPFQPHFPIKLILSRTDYNLDNAVIIFDFDQFGSILISTWRAIRKSRHPFNSLSSSRLAPRESKPPYNRTVRWRVNPRNMLPLSHALSLL